MLCWAYKSWLKIERRWKEMTKWSAFIIFIMRSINELMTIRLILKPPKKKFFAVWGIYYCLCPFQNYFQLNVYLTINKCECDWTLFSDRFELYELLVRPVEEPIKNFWKLNKLNFERNSKCSKVFWLYYFCWELSCKHISWERF